MAARRLVLLCDRNNEAQVRLHERSLSLFTITGGAAQLPLLRRREPLLVLFNRSAGFHASLDLLRQADLIVLGQQRVLPDIGEIQADEILFVAINSFFSHWFSVSFVLVQPKTVPITAFISILVEVGAGEARSYQLTASAVELRLTVYVRIPVPSSLFFPRVLRFPQVKYRFRAVPSANESTTG